MTIYITRITSENIDDVLDSIQFAEPTTDEKYGNVSVRVSVTDENGDKQPLVLESPWMKAFVGVSKYEAQGSNTRPKYKLPVSFHKQETYERQAVFREFFEKLDEKLIDEGFTNAGPWIKRGGEPRAVVKAFYSPSLTYSKNKSGEVDERYPPKLQFKLGSYLNDDGSTRFAAPVYKDRETRLESPVDSIQKGGEVKAIVECNGVWGVNGKFGLGWRVNQIKAKEVKSSSNTYAFEDDSDDEDDTQASSHVFEEDSTEPEVEESAPPTPPPELKKRRGGRKRATAKKKTTDK
jgi:hypothetical protein